jgi:hypothetical protein
MADLLVVYGRGAAGFRRPEATPTASVVVCPSAAATDYNLQQTI